MKTQFAKIIFLSKENETLQDLMTHSELVSITYRGICTPAAFACEGFLHFEEEVTGNIARKQFGIGGGDLRASWYIYRGSHHHVIGVLLEGVIGIGYTIVIHQGV